MKYIDFGTKEKPDLSYYQGVADGIAWFIEEINSHAGTSLKEIQQSWHSKMAEWPHKHWSSILGPYCVGCRCKLPGPNGEWE